MIHDIVTNFITLLKKKVGTKLKKFRQYENLFLFLSIVFCVDRRKPIKVVSIAAKCTVWKFRNLTLTNFFDKIWSSFITNTSHFLNDFTKYFSSEFQKFLHSVSFP